MERKNERLPIFTERFRELQEDRSNTEFAEFLEISRQTVGFYCNGDRVPDALTLIKIAEKCNVSSDWLLGLSSERSTNADMRKICEFTGLSELAVENLANRKNRSPIIDVYKYLLENPLLLQYIANYFADFTLRGIKKEPFKYIPIKPGSLYAYMNDVHFATVIRALQSTRKKFKEAYANDESFEAKSIYEFLLRHADIEKCLNIIDDVEGNGFHSDIDELTDEDYDALEGLEDWAIRDDYLSDLQKMDEEKEKEEIAIRNFLQFLEENK